MLIWARQEGHTYLPREALLQGAAEMLECDPDLLDETLDTLIIDGTLQYSMAGETDAVYLPALHHMEKDCAKRLLLLARAPEDEATMDLDRELLALERELKIELAQEQRAAVLSALREGAMVITGGPGTGKTTILQFILRIMTRLGLDYALCAPTGRAAKRMTEATGFEAATIHRLLEYGGEGQSRFSRNEDNPLFYDMVVVDEMSMVDLPLMYALLRALPQGTRLIMVGDADQLPPVGAGTVLHDIIESGVLPVTRLTEIFRQSDRSGIAKNAQRINAGQPPQPEPDSDFTFLNCPVTELALEKVVSLCSGGDPSLFTCDPQCGVQVLSPTKKGRSGSKTSTPGCRRRSTRPRRTKRSASLASPYSVRAIRLCRSRTTTAWNGCARARTACPRWAWAYSTAISAPYTAWIWPSRLWMYCLTTNAWRAIRSASWTNWSLPTASPYTKARAASFPSLYCRCFQARRYS
jgi:exodeoxyribonuclease V alpha subunit